MSIPVGTTWQSDCGSVLLHCGSSLHVMPTLAAGSFDSIVTDPPYGLEFMGKEWDSFRGEAWRSVAGMSKPGIGDRPTAWPSFGGGDSANATCASCGGRMRGKKKCRCEHPDWRVKGRPLGQRNARAESMQSFGVWCEAWAAESLRVAKPGAHLLAFGGTRTYHRLTCAIEDAGWEIRDCIMWIYGSGFPKSHNLRGDWQGFGTALKPAYEPIIVARKPLIGTVAENVLRHGTGAMNIDVSRVPLNGEASTSEARRKSTFGGIQGVKACESEAEGKINRRGSPDVYAANHGGELGRWPANVIHDGSDEVVGLFPDTGKSTGGRTVRRSGGGNVGSGKASEAEWSNDDPGYGDSGSAARFFYCAKASKSDRGEGNNHPTVKPTSLMEYLIKLVTPPGGHVLDPFGGSGTTAVAAKRLWFRCTVIELNEEYCEIIRRRVERENKEADLFAGVAP